MRVTSGAAVRELLLCCAILVWPQSSSGQVFVGQDELLPTPTETQQRFYAASKLESERKLAPAGDVSPIESYDLNFKIGAVTACLMRCAEEIADAPGVAL